MHSCPLTQGGSGRGGSHEEWRGPLWGRCAHCHGWDKLICLSCTPDEAHGGCLCEQGGLSKAATALQLLQAFLCQSLALLLPARPHFPEVLPIGLQPLPHALARCLKQRG